MRTTFFLIVVVLFALQFKAQDKLFFTDGSVRKGMIVSNAKDAIYFKANDTAQTEIINKGRLILVEDYKGNRYLYGSAESEKKPEQKLTSTENSKKNMLSWQPFGFLVGRFSLQYERLTKDLKFGIVVPFALTFNPFGTIYPASEDTDYVEPTGISFITGLDLNYYLGRRESFQFFIGPRIRYGTDMMAGEVQGYTIQTQFGWKIGSPSKRFVQHLSFGFGFVRAISVGASPTVNPKQSIAWGSINYRLGIRW